MRDRPNGLARLHYVRAWSAGRCHGTGLVGNAHGGTTLSGAGLRSCALRRRSRQRCIARSSRALSRRGGGRSLGLSRSTVSRSRWSYRLRRAHRTRRLRGLGFTIWSRNTDRKLFFSINVVGQSH